MQYNILKNNTIWILTVYLNLAQCTNTAELSDNGINELCYSLGAVWGAAEDTN